MWCCYVQLDVVNLRSSRCLVYDYYLGWMSCTEAEKLLPIIEEVMFWGMLHGIPQYSSPVSEEFDGHRKMTFEKYIRALAVARQCFVSGRCVRK